MTSVKVLLIGRAIDVTVTNLILNLTPIQLKFDFQIHQEIIKPPKIPAGRGSLHTEDFKRLAKRVYGDKYADDLIVIVCNLKLEDDDLFIQLMKT